MKTQTRIVTQALILALLAGLALRAGAAVSASGGNYTNDIPGYRIHVFTNSATASNFVVSAASLGDAVQVLVVGGGGAGGGVNNGGGGGAGGFIYSNGYAVVAGSNYTVTVGVGGPANAGTAPVAGSNSAFGAITATGGGGGGGGNGGQAGGDGGSGGGGAYSNGSKGNRTPSPIQGNDGAAGVNDGSIYPAGGGGGAGAPASGAQGGSGTRCTITEPGVWYAGGGSGGRNSTVVTGGKGGGGNGAGNSPVNTAPTAGQPGTGGGGGGCQTSSSTGGSGGSGIVIVRYPYRSHPWIYSMPITFTNDARLNTLTNFPALVIFDTSKVNYGQFQANGQDLRFMDGNGAELAYEVELWDPSSNSYIWVQIPTMTAGCSITAYWGNASAALPSYRTNGTVWADGYALVEHMAVSNGTTVADATANGNTATIYNEYGYTPTGMVGRALNLSRTADRNNGLQLANSVTIGNNWAISCWFNGLLGTGDWRTLARGPTAHHQILVKDTGSELGSYMGGFSQYGSATLPADTNWRHIMVVGTGGTSAAYVNGQLIGTGTFQSTEAVKAIGYHFAGSQKFASYLDEVRIDVVARSSNWVWACYQTAASNTTFSTYGAVVAAAATNYKLQLAFTNYARAEVLTNFPVLVVFSNGLYGTFSYNTFTAPATGGDLRFLDSTETTNLDFEIESWNTNGSSYAWVRVPLLTSNTTIYAKWGGADTTLPACTTNGAVWTNGFAAVWHMANGTTLSAADSSANAKHGGASNMTATAGVSDGAGWFNGSNTTATGGFIQAPLVSSAINSVTLSAWINTTNGNQAGQGILYNGSDNNGNGYGMFVNKEGVTSGNLYILYGGKAWWDTLKPITQRAWHQTVVTLSADGKTASAYVDGAYVGNNTFASAPNTPTLETDIGRDNYIVGNPATPRYFYGAIDEARMATTIRSTNWIWAEYVNMASNALFNGYGTVQAPASTPALTIQPVANLTTNSADLTATLSTAGADVYVYWDTQDRGTNFTWAYTNSPLTAFTNTTAGTTITNTAAGLSPGTSYAYRFYATNTASGLSAWSSVGNFATPWLPAVDNSTNGVTGIGVGTAIFSGRVTATNGAVCYGKFFWGPTDGSNNPTAWAYTNDITGTVTQGVAYSATLSNLLYGQQYYYRAAASNSYGLGWATNTVAFLTTRPPSGRVLPIAANPVAWYRFDSPANFGLDSSTNGFNMTVYSSPVAAPDAKFSGAVAWSNALSQYMQLTGSAWTSLQGKLNTTNGQTAVMWVKKAAAQIAQQNTSGIMRGLGSGSNDHYTWDSPAQAYFMAFANSRINTIPPPSNAHQQLWHMIALVRDPNDSSTGRRVYFLTNAVVTAAATATPGTLTWGADFTIGFNANNNYFGGSMDDFMLFDQALSTNDLSALYSDPGTVYAGVSISNSPASDGTSTSAVLNATLQGAGAVFNVSAYYWVAGAGSSNVVAVGTYTNVASTNLSVSVTNLTPGTSYACTFLASNAATNLWAAPAISFITGDLTVQATDPTGRVTLADTAAFTVYRPAGCTNDDLVVNYSLNGTATNGTHCSIAPVSGAVVIARGQTNGVITVTPLNVSAPQQTVVLTLASGPYAVGAANSATCTLAAIGATYYTSQTGDWTNSATWGGSGPPSSGDQGMVRHGDGYNTFGAVVATTNLGVAGNYATITVTTSGWVAAKAWASSTGTIIANPVTFDGGKLGSGAWDAGGGEWTGPITITTNGLIVATGRNGSPKLSGKVSGPGGITLTSPDVVGAGGLSLNNASNDFAGNVVVTQGTLTLTCDHALPTGKVVNVYSDGKVGFDVSQTYSSEPPPIVNLSGGSLRMGIGDAAHNVTNGLAVNVLAAGGYFNSGRPSWATGRRVTGPIAIASGGTLNVGGSRGGGWALDGPISGAGMLRFYVYDTYAGLPVSEIAGTNNTHSGGTLVATYGPSAAHTTIARAEGSLGTGPVTTESNTVMQLDKVASADWTLTNTLAGAGTFKVEDGSANYRLTAAGTVSPGTNAGAAVAVLAVTGKFAFARSGGAPATLAIDVASAGTTPGVNHDELLGSTGDVTLASSITNCALVVTRVPSPIQMNGLTLTILSAPGANFSSYPFASVTGLGAGGSVVYGNGSIALTWTAAAPIINNGAYSNLAATACDVSGYLSSTGDTPTLVRCYWGTSPAGTSGWMYTNNLGTQAIGTVWTSLTGLTSTVTYYYRFYATNDVGEYWSVATSNFTTLGDVYWNDAASGYWNADNANTWGQGANVYPYRLLNDHVTIDSHTVTLKNSLTGGTAPADITLATNGTLQAGTAFTTYSIDAPVTFNGGTMYGGGSGYGLTFNGPVTMQGISTANISYVDSCTFNGPISGAGKLIAWFRHFNSGVTLANAGNTNWTGTLDVNGSDAGSVSVTTNGGLGRATANVYKNINLFVTQNYGVAPKPTINVYPGGGIWFGVDTVNDHHVVISDIPVAMIGGQWASSSAAYQYYGAFTQSGPVTLNSNTVVGCGDYGIRWTFSGSIGGPGQFIYQSPGANYGAGITYLSGTNTFAGGTWVQSGLLVAKNTNALGSGTVQVDYNTNAASHGLIQLAATTPSSNYWTLANALIGGCGTNVALQVEDGAGTNTLTVLGTVDPGTNGTTVTTNSTGIYRIDGNVAFGTGGRLRIHIAGTSGVAGVDFDRLLVDHTLSGLGNAVLEVNVNTNLDAAALAGQEFVVASNATALAGAFGTVQWSGQWNGQVTYNAPAGTVKISNLGTVRGTVFRFR